jgi:cellulose synthase/poly-beta-1,6-N-acetylglucosamine synthase-like glycosyltransferase
LPLFPALTLTAPVVAVAAAAGALLVPSAVLCVESLSALLPRRAEPDRSGERRPRMAILMPAHDEETGIAKTVTALRAELAPGDRLLVIADNCTDRTAERAREAGAEVAERTDPERRGKGFALSFGANILREDPPEVVLVMDADCRVEQGTLAELAKLAHRSGRPVQAVYLMHPPEREGLSSVSAFAFLVRNLVRPSGLKRLGMPCQLTGTGMAFPWELYRDAPATESFLVEDLLMGHELALRGRAPILCDDVQVGSDFPTGEAASLKQRRRWEHGELSILLGTAPRLLAKGLLRGEPGLVALALDAAVPPLAFLVLLQGATTAAGVTLAMVGGSSVPLVLSLGGAALLGVGLSAAWVAHGRDVLPLSDLAKIPRYVLWKLPLYATFLKKGAHSEWERTERT